MWKVNWFISLKEKFILRFFPASLFSSQDDCFVDVLESLAKAFINDLIEILNFDFNKI